MRRWRSSATFSGMLLTGREATTSTTQVSHLFDDEFDVNCGRLLYRRQIDLSVELVLSTVC